MNMTKRQVEILKKLLFTHIDNMVELIDMQIVTDNDYESIHDDLSEITECNDLIQQLIAYQPRKAVDDELPFQLTLCNVKMHKKSHKHCVMC